MLREGRCLSKNVTETQQGTRLAWTTIVAPNELDAHMTETGQLEANAEVLNGLMREYNKLGPHMVYVPGCGTGQLFAALNHQSPLKDTYLFCDIREEFLQKLERRLSRDVKYSVRVDDIEASKVTEKYDAAVIVLVLEHVDWNLALTNVLKVLPEMIFIILQVNGDAEAGAVTKQRKLKPTIKKFAEVANPQLVSTAKLEAQMTDLGFKKIKELDKPVQDNKIMRGLCFARAT
jgi:SAM-dependent methyltransferase